MIMMHHNLFFFMILSFLSNSTYSEVSVDLNKYSTSCGKTLPYHLSIYSNDEHYYVSFKITNYLGRDIWIPTGRGSLWASRNLEIILHIGKYYTPYIMIDEYTPKTKKLRMENNILLAIK